MWLAQCRAGGMVADSTHSSGSQQGLRSAHHRQGFWGPLSEGSLAQVGA